MGLTLDAAIAASTPSLPLGIAYSGGADSTALLLAASQRWPGQVHALHVHHGLQSAADAFEAQCSETCAKLSIPQHVARIDARHAPGESPEDAARRARYATLAKLAQDNALACVLLAQHADDQVETMLLALSRGAGLPGLAAMPPAFERHGMRFERPLLQVSGPSIREWLAARGASFIEDPTNADTAFTRNRIRHRLLPAIEQAFPQFRDTFARSARHAAEAQRLLEGVARDDLAGMGGEPVIAELQSMPRERQANLLRRWLRESHGELASTAQMDELLAQVRDCTTRGHDLRLKVGRGFVVRAGGVLRFDAPEANPPGAGAAAMQ